MRSSVWLAALLLGLSAAASALAQEGDAEGGQGTLLDIGGGVRVPVPRENRTSPDVISPEVQSDLTPARRGEQGMSTVRGRQRGRTRTNVEGEEEAVYQSSRVAGVEHSADQRDRFSWFYAAEEVYYGIIPHIRDTLPHIARYQQQGQQSSQRNEITWIGFQAFPEYTRVFVQLARFPSYTVEEHEDGAVLAIVFENTHLSLSNFARFIDTSYFGRSVDLIDAEALPGNRTRVIVWRHDGAAYTVSLDGDYLNVDFQDAGASTRR